MPENRPPTAPAPHRTTTSEQGSFCYAQCTCGWRGPARRSRDKARQDATTHATRTSPPGATAP